METIKQIKTALILVLLFTLLTGLIYPMIVTGFAQLLFHWQANGSFVIEQDKNHGSLLIGQPFVSANYFWSRPSATTPFPYNASNSSGGNLGPSNPDFLNTVKKRVAALQASDPNNHHPIPVDLVTASGSGLDPEISILAALYQIPRIAKTRGLAENQLEILVHKVSISRTFGVLGEPRVNVLQLNLALDTLGTQTHG